LALGVVNKNPCPEVFHEKGAYSLTLNDLRNIKIQLEDLRFSNSEYIEQLEDERQRLLDVVRDLLKRKAV
jgi:hypothetical protein